MSNFSKWKGTTLTFIRCSTKSLPDHFCECRFSRANKIQKRVIFAVMPWQKTLILLLFGVILPGFAICQKVHHGGKSVYTRSRFNYNATKVKGAKAKTVCPIFEHSKYPYQGVGFKLGDPFALTYKYYFNKIFSIAADLGK